MTHGANSIIFTEQAYSNWQLLCTLRLLIIRPYSLHYLRYFFHTGFNGANYRGWQRQSNINTVQQVLETVLTSILKEPITAIGCGRTDAQVHASQFFFHIDVKQPWDFDLLFRVNKMLPDDIAIFEIIPVQDSQHAQYDARQRTYDYFIHSYKDPFLSNISSWYPGKYPKLEEMKKALALLTKYDDYRSFCKSPDLYKHTICNVTSARLFINPGGGRLRIQLTADRFLWRMVRLLVGKLLQIGKGEMSVGELENLLIEKTQLKVWNPAYPQGLFLSKVIYPYLELPTHVTFMSINQPEEDWGEV